MTTIAELELRFLHRKLSSTDGTPTVYTADSGTVRTVVDAALTESDDYWNGALLRWDTGPNAGLWSSIADFVASSDTLTFDEDLPNAVASGHTFTLFQGGKHASDQRVPGMATPSLANVTGFDVVHAAHLNGEGTGTLRFYDATNGLTWEPPSGIEGPEVDISGISDGDRVVLVSGAADADVARSQFLQLERNSDSLPSGDEEDDLSLDLVPTSFLPRVTGAESTAGVVLYRAVALRNVGSSAQLAVRAYAASPSPSAAPAALTAVLGTSDDTLQADDLTGWSSSGFVYNVDKDDLRYFFGRSGNSASVLSPSGGLRGKTAVSWDVDDEIVAFPWFDLGLDAPGASSVFEDPSSETTAPSGVTFSCPTTAEDGLSIGDLAAGAVHCIWLRFTIPAGARPIEAGRVDLRVYAES